ncbi:class II aldolase/adducin family protein [Pleurocapsales cyanobacterium LEGE 06147]|nr:class II aldolase/adducin family protein [Pleurocapsales cyanobacterium LEGE 06147]
MHWDKNLDEGYIKYQCNWIEASSISRDEIKELNRWREKLYQLNLIGQYDNGIGFDNISIRDGENISLPAEISSTQHTQPAHFIISGTTTGGIAHLIEKHYTKVIDFDWEKNSVTCVGLIKASSEALTHAAVYVANPQVNAVIHVHHRQLWQQLINRVGTSKKNCAYGTPEMAKEIIRLCQENLVKEQKIIIMSGHEEGIITFGNNLDEAGNIILKYYNQL